MMMAGACGPDREWDSQLSVRPRISLPEAALRQWCRRWHVAELALFGSALRDDFGPNSDADFLVTYAPGRRPRIEELETMTHELEQLIGRPVDVVERQIVEQSPNYIRRQHILDTAEVICGL